MSSEQMKNVKKITKLRLDRSEADEYLIIGLVSHEPDYKLSLVINKKLGISLRHSSPIIIDTKPDNSFSRFTVSDSSGATFSLISNKSENEFLIGKLKNVDYLFIAYDPEKQIKADGLVSAMRTTEFVNAVFLMNSDHLKDKNIHYLIH